MSQEAIEPNLRDKYGRAALLLAVGAGRESVVRLLLDSPKVDISLRDYWQQSPILVATVAGHINILRLLINRSHGRDDVNAKDSGGLRPIYRAVSGGHTAMVDLLLSHGAKPNIRCGQNAFDDRRMRWSL